MMLALFIQHAPIQPDAGSTEAVSGAVDQAQQGNLGAAGFLAMFAVALILVVPVMGLLTWFVKKVVANQEVQRADLKTAFGLFGAAQKDNQEDARRNTEAMTTMALRSEGLVDQVKRVEDLVNEVKLGKVTKEGTA